jgi:hypothetical protein
VVLIIDEAQNLSYRVLEEVRLLSGVETAKEKVLRIILVGQPELNAALNSPELVQLTQRVRLRFHLNALSRSETSAYIDHRLEVAGSQGRRIFAEDIYPTIYRYTGGVPRLINTLCDTSMMAAFGRNQDTVTHADVEAAIRELQWQEYGTSTHPSRALDAKSMPAGARAAEPTASTVGRILLACEGKTVLERELKPGRIVIGRTPDNDVQIDSKYISRHHCQIVTQADSCVIEDLNSTNGIAVQSKRVRRHNLNDGDIVQVWDHEIMYIDERMPRVRAALDPTETDVIEKP